MRETAYRGGAAPAAWPWLLALAAATFDVAAFWPGLMSFDSAFTWWQARGGQTLDVVPQALVWVWRACEAISSGPGLVFALHLTLFWSGLALLARALRLRAAGTAALLLLVGFTPVPWLLRGHVWTDVGLFSALLLASGALACAHVGGSRRWLALALPALFYAAALRHNALPAMLPFALWFAWLALRDTRTPSRTKTVAAAAGLLAAMWAVNLGLSHTAQRRVLVWPSLAQFDLVAVSVATDRLLLPDFMYEPGLDVAELAGTFRPWSNTAMFSGLRHALHEPFLPVSNTEQARTLRRAWIDAVAGHPAAWAAHRWALTRALFGTHAPTWPRELVYVDDEVQYRDNPPVARNGSALHAALMRAAAALLPTPALAAWPYGVIALLAFALAWRRREEMPARFALILLASATLFAAPLPLLAPAAELRYLGWPCVASLVALACALAGPRGSTR